jgi:hypothetical protein
VPATGITVTQQIILYIQEDIVGVKKLMLKVDFKKSE